MNIDLDNITNTNTNKQNKVNWNKTKEFILKYKYVLSSILALSVLLVCILVPLSFHYIHYNEYAFTRNKFGKTDTDKVLERGRYFLPLNFDIIRFSSTYNEIRFEGDNGQNIFTKDGYQIKMNLAFWYKIPSKSLKNIYNKYGLNYQNSVINEAKLIIKNFAGTATTGSNIELSKYINDRRNISKSIAEALNKELYSEFGIDVPVKYVQMMYVQIPDTLVTQYTKTVEQVQKNQLEQNKQTLEQIKAETQTLVTNIKVQSDFVLNSAKIDAEKIVLNTKAFANSIVTSQRGKGLRFLMSTLNITTQDEINKMIRIMSIGDNTNNKIFYNIDNNIIINNQ